MRKPSSREIISASVELCEKLMFVSCTPNLLARTCDFRKCKTFHPMLISNLSSHRQNRNLEIIPIYSDVQCFPHDNIDWIHLCDECKRSNVLNVCHMLSCTSWWHEQACSQTTRYQVYQFDPTTDISDNLWAFFDNSPTDPISSSLDWWSSIIGIATLCNCWVVLFAISFHAFLCMTLTIIGPWRNVCFRILRIK